MLPQSTALAAPQPVTALAAFSPLQMFELVQQQASYIAKSDMIPKEYRGKPENCAIALEISTRIGGSYFMVMQSLDVIHGRPSWRAQFLIGMLNASGRFGPLQFEMKVDGPEKTVPIIYHEWEGSGPNAHKVERKLNYTYVPTTCRAYATSKVTGETVYGPPVSYDMAIHEGWVAKAGSKWQGPMRELMLTYRAGAFFARIHAPDLALGMQTAEEIHDTRTIDVESEVVGGPSQAQRTMRDANPYNRGGVSGGTSQAAPAAEAAAADTTKREAVPAEQAKENRRATRDAAKQEAAPAAETPDADGERGIKAFYQSHIDEPGENSKGPYNKMTLHYSLPDGTGKKAVTFSTTVQQPVYALQKGDEIWIKTAANANPRFADNLQSVEAVNPRPAAEEQGSGGSSEEEDIPY